MLSDHIVVYKDVRKILSGFFDSDYKYGCAILARMINVAVKIVIFQAHKCRFGC